MAFERPVLGSEPDLFDHKPLSARISRTLLDHPEDQAIALLGPFGSGKSSILSWVRDELEQSDEPFTIVAEFNCWAMPHSEDAPRIALERIVDAFGRFVDVQEFRGLPKAYQRLIAAEPSGWLAKIIGADGERDPLEELRRLTPVLEALNARIVLFIEDADRAGRRFETHHLERLLWTLRDVPRVSFVLSIDATRARFDYRKLCDIIEIVPAVDPERVLAILSMAHAYWMEGGAFIDPRRETRQNSRLDLNQPRSDLLEYFHRGSRDTTTHALTALLSSPRRIKHLVRRVNGVWQSLRGEVDLDDVIVLTALRDGDRTTFDFLVEHIDAARQEPRDLAPGTKTVKDDWKRMLEATPNAAAVQKLVNLLGIKQLTTELGRSTDAVQGVHNEDPDYFRRILAEQLAPDDISDQLVLADMDRWQQNRATPMFSRLCTATEESKRYVEVWEFFSQRLTDDELFELAEGLIRETLRTEGVAASMNRRPALFAVWRRCIRRRHRNDAVEWLSRLIVAAIPVNLRFADDLFYFWGSVEHPSILPDGGRAQVRVAMLQAAKTTFTNAQSLLRTLGETHPLRGDREGYALLHFLQPPSGRSVEKAELSERDWLVPLLVEAARARPNVVVPNLVLLVGKTHDVFSHNENDRSHINSVYSLEREKVTEFFGDQTDDVLKTFAAYAGDDECASEAKGQAEKWLAERRT